MRITEVSVVCILIGTLFMGACSKPAATVNGKKISRETLDLHVKERMDDHKQRNVAIDEKKLRAAIIQELVSERLTLDEAATRGITVSDTDVAAEIESIKKRVGEEAYLKSLKEKGLTADSFRSRIREKMIMTKFIESFGGDDMVTEQQMNDYYTNSPKPFLKPARVNMKIVEFQTEEGARAAAAEIRRSVDFDQLSQKLSDEKKATVSDYGWVSPEFFSPDMAASIKGLKEGQHGGPYKGQKGFYLVRVKERQDESIMPYEEVKEMIKNTLLQQVRYERYMKWLEQKRSTSKIVINVA